MGQQSLLGLEQQTFGSDDFYTPEWVFDALGLAFDCDVAAPPGGVDYIPASKHFSVGDDGLAQDWHGLVWCNPPYSGVTPWAEKWSAHPDGVFMGPLVKSMWVTALFATAGVIWIPRERIIFTRPSELGIPGDTLYPIFIAGRGGGAAGVRRLAATIPGVALVPDGS